VNALQDLKKRGIRKEHPEEERDWGNNAKGVGSSKGKKETHRGVETSVTWDSRWGWMT